MTISLTTPASQAPAIQGPVISGRPAGVLDAAGYTPNIAQGSVFVVKGSNLSPDGVVQGGYPLPVALNGVSIAFTPAAGGASVPAYLLYTYNTAGVSQLAGILPSTAAPGSYNVSVTVNGVASPAVPVTLVARKFGLFTADSSGTGAAALQEIDSAGAYHQNRFTTQLVGSSADSIAPAHPGDYLVAYGTGLGPIQVPDQDAPGVIDLSGQASVQVLVGGEAITPLYAGRSPGFAGVDQINFQLPPDVQTACAVSIQVSVAGQLSNLATIAIAPAGATVCGPAPVSNDVLSRLDQGGTLTVGSFWLTQVSPAAGESQFAGLGNMNESASGAFVKYTGFQFAGAAALLNVPGTCQVSSTVGNAAQLMFGSIGTYLDAGTLTVNGPGIGFRQLTRDTASGAYSVLLGASTSPANVNLPLGYLSLTSSPAITSGPYQITGSGGADIGKFSASGTVGQPMTISSSLPATINRAQDLTLSWAGGTSGGLVSVTGISGAVLGGTAAQPIYDAVKFTCTATAAAGSITIPSSLLLQLPVTPAGGSGMGYLAITSGGQPVQGNGMFTAPLTAGGSIDDGFFLGSLGTFTSTTYQ
jgi:uncharacterized protein (TIGR03437 family)